jgi:DNA-binding NtrC family response regulator
MKIKLALCRMASGQSNRKSKRTLLPGKLGITQAMSAQIVVFGKDPVLLETRQRILERAGFDCVAVSGIGQLMPLAQQEDVELVVLCSSVDQIESRAILSAIDGLGRTDLKRLVLTKDKTAFPEPGRLEIVETPTTPQRFLSLVEAAVGTSLSGL